MFTFVFLGISTITRFQLKKIKTKCFQYILAIQCGAFECNISIKKQFHLQNKRLGTNLGKSSTFFTSARFYPQWKDRNYHTIAINWHYHII